MTSMNINHVNTMAQLLSNDGTLRAKDKAGSLKNIFEFIVNFISFGSVQNKRARQYEAFVENMAAELFKSEPSDKFSRIPERLNFNYSGYDIVFTLPGENADKADFVSLCVSKNGEKIESTVDKKTFCRICTAMLICKMCDVPLTPVLLTDKGCINLAGANLPNADLRGMNLGDADFGGANLTGANLEDANLEGANLKGANLEKATLMRAILKHADASEANLRGAHLKETNLKNANFEQAVLIRAHLESADASEAKFMKADLSFAYLEKARFDKSDLRDASLKCVNMCEGRFDMARLGNADMSGAVAMKTHLERADMRGGLYSSMPR
ncbi:pentapeptide repeat-containing protein [Acerihabitans sp. KWT182]|uniref:Pentapeptide repeat-containing protein n=1 Tax=Acerihabitans sp. KWT182 TaxID=3157919 RepID=A0AAU7QCH7_9GAMM